MIRAVLLAGAILASSGAAQAATVAPVFSQQVSLVTIKAPGGPRQVRARAVVGPELQAEAARLLGKRCGSVGRVLQLQDDPLGPDVIVYRAECNTGVFQISVVGTAGYVKSWTGVLRD